MVNTEYELLLFRVAVRTISRYVLVIFRLFLPINFVSYLPCSTLEANLYRLYHPSPLPSGWTWPMGGTNRSLEGGRKRGQVFILSPLVSHILAMVAFLYSHSLFQASPSKLQLLLGSFSCSFRLKASHCYQFLHAWPLLAGSLNPSHTSVNHSFIKFILPSWSVSSLVLQEESINRPVSRTTCWADTVKTYIIPDPAPKTLIGQ